MKRRTFVKSALAAGVAAAIPGCNRPGSTATTSGASTIDAISLDGNQLDIERAAVSELADGMTGSVYLPDDAGYDTARVVWNGMFDHKRPAMIAQCRTVDDVRSAVTFAAERNLLVSVKGGGHSLPGKSTNDGGMMIDLSPMHATEISPQEHTMTAGGGALLGHLDNTASAHNQITTTGIVSHTGVGGFTLGGGMGRVDRAFGLAIDNLLAATVVTAAGDVVQANADENPELYWGLRGGGGNFGVVTEFVYRTHDFNPMVYGGTLFYERSRELLEFYAEYHETAPDEANVEPTFMPGPDGEPVALVELVWAGDYAAGEKAFAPWLDAPGFLQGELKPLPYKEIQTSLDVMLGHGKQNYLKSGLVTALTPELIDVMWEYLSASATPTMWFQHLGGATSRVAPDATAYLHRDAAFNIGVDYVSDDPAMNEAGIAAVRTFYNALSPHMIGFYTNLNEESEKQTWGNWGENYPRLSALKAQYDPGNLFRLNANIQPAA